MKQFDDTTRAIIKYNLPNETHIILSNNEFETLYPEEFVCARNLQILDMTNNPNFEFKENEIFLKNKNVRNLLFDGCGISKIYHSTFEEVPNLSYIELSNNFIKHVKEAIFWNNPKLTVVNLRDNDIVEIDKECFETNKNLRKLIMDHNYNFDFIENEPFLNSTSLQIYSCNNCGITTIYQNTFKKMEKLKELYLNSNKISNIFSTAFGNTRQLERFDVEDNKLGSFPTKLFDILKRLKYLHLDGNDFKPSILNNDLLKNYKESFRIESKRNNTHRFFEKTLEEFVVPSSLTITSRTLTAPTNEALTDYRDCIEKKEFLDFQQQINASSIHSIQTCKCDKDNEFFYIFVLFIILSFNAVLLILLIALIKRFSVEQSNRQKTFL